jgi:uncharacterized protein (TIGR03663 family)
LKSGASLPEASLSGTAPAESASPRLKWARWSAFLVIALFGLAVRVPKLDVRPMHTDEAINGYIVGQVLGGEPFTYDPKDRHGPALAALALPLVKMQGASSFSDLTERELRLTSVVAGTITILLFGAAVEMFGFLPCALAAILFAVAPLPVYYDRYFIHESLFCAATFGLIISTWRACKMRSVNWAAVAGGSAALMMACKETAILHFFALAVAGFVFWVWNLRGQNARGPFRFGSMLAAAGSFVTLVLILFTWFGRNWKNLHAQLHVATDVIARAGGQGHEKPFWYYGKLLTVGWSGGLLVALALVGFLIALKRRDASPCKWLAYYALIIATIYSLIPYKTPWLALNLWLPLALLFGIAVDALWCWSRRSLSRYAAVLVFCALAGSAAVLIAHDTRLRVFLQPADERNPYAYAHTSDDILGISAEISDLAHQDGIVTPRVAVIAADAWPLPWYLRHFSQVGFWQPGQQVADADFYVTSTEAANQYADRLKDFRPEFFGVRPGVLILLWSPAPK